MIKLPYFFLLQKFKFLALWRIPRPFIQLILRAVFIGLRRLSRKFSKLPPFDAELKISRNISPVSHNP
jgi:hypothetical protein